MSTSTELTLLRADTGEMLAVTVSDTDPPDTDPLGVGHVDDDRDLPLAWGDAIEAQLLAETGRTWEDIVADTHATIAHGRSVFEQHAIGDVVRPASVNIAEAAAAAAAFLDEVDAELADEHQAQQRGGWVPEVPTGAELRTGLERIHPPQYVDVTGEIPTGAPDAMQEFWDADDTPTGGLHGRITGRPWLVDLTAEPRRTRWARTAGDILAWIGRGRP